MLRSDMAALAEVRQLCLEHAVVIRAMRVVTRDAGIGDGACSHRNGPRFSAWQLVHASSTVVPTFSSLTFVDPCTLWQEVHSSLPSRTGM